MNPTASRIGLAIRIARVRNRLSQRALGEEIGFTGQCIYKIENGLCDTRVGTLYKIATALNVSIISLIEGSEYIREKAGG